LGEEQYAWLEEVMRDNSEANVTLIMSGVQVLPDRYGSFVEEVGIETKTRIMRMVQKLEKSGVVFLSGDVHYAQFFTSKCASVSGYVMPELCSSGMTHILTDFYFNIESTVNLHTPLYFKVRNLSEIQFLY